MAFTFTDLNKFNLERFSDIIVLTVGLIGELERGATVLRGIESGRPVVHLTSQDKALRLSKGCGDNTTYSGISDNVKYYEHAPITLPVVICLQDLWGKMLARGINLSADFSETQLAAFIQDELMRVSEADLLRLVWLDGLTTGNEAYGIFKNGGFIKQYIASGATPGVLTLSNEGVIDALRACIDTQRPNMKEKSEFFVSSNVLRFYKNYLEAKDSSASFVTLVDGKPQYYFEGYKITELPHVSNNLSDTTYTAFIAFTAKENIQLALENEGLFVAPFRQDAKDEKYYSNTKFAADAMLATPETFKLYVAAKAGA